MSFVGYGISYLCGSYYLICSFAVCGKFKDVVSFNKTGSGESAVAVLCNVLPACALIGGKLNGGFCFTKGRSKVKVCGIFKRIYGIKLCIPFVCTADSLHRKLVFSTANIYNYNAGTFRVGCSVNSGVLSAAADSDSVIGHFKDGKTFGNAFNIHPVALFACAGVARTVICRGSNFDMLAAGNYGVVEVRLDHNVRGIAVDNLPCAAVCTKSEGFANAEGKVILSIYVQHNACFHTVNHICIGNGIFCALRIFVRRKGYGDIFIFFCVKITCFGYFAFHRNTVHKVSARSTKYAGNGSVFVFGGGSNGELFNVEVFNLIEESHRCALRCSYGVINKVVKNKGFVLSSSQIFAKCCVRGGRNTIILGELFAEVYSPVIKQCVAMSEKKSRSYNSAVIIDVLCTGDNALHFAGHNVDGVIADCFYIFIGGVVVDSYKGNLLLAVNRLAVRADFYADRRFKGHSAKLLIICGINGAVGIHTLGNSHFVNMVFADHAFINNLVGCKGVFAVLVAIEGYVNGGGSDIHGDGVFIFARSRENIAAVNAFAVLALGAGFISGADNVVALCAFYGFGVVAVVFGNIGGMFLISGADFLAGADNLAALFAGNGHGVVAVALCGVCGFGFSADMVARRGGNGDGKLSALNISVVYLLKIAISQIHFFKLERRHFLFAYIFFCFEIKRKNRARIYSLPFGSSI